MRHTHSEHERPRALYMPRSRGAVIGLILILLGAWGALAPFIGPLFNWAYTGDPAWTWTTARGWLEVLPGVVAAIGGLLLVASANRGGAMLGGWLAVVAGAWFVVGRTFAATLNTGDVGQPLAATDLKRALLEVTYFTGLGALIVLLGGAAVARVAARHARDVAAAEPAAGGYAPAGEPALYDESRNATVPAAGQFAAAEPQPGGYTRRRFGGGLFRRHHHAGV